MASIAEASRLVRTHNPSVSLVTVEALHAFFHMTGMLSDSCLTAVTFPETVCRRKFYFSMRFVTSVAGETRHCPLRWNLVASHTLYIRHHLGRFFRKRMALQTGKRLHSNAMDTFVFVTALAGLFIRRKTMEALTVTHFARDIYHEYMLGMAVRFSERDGALRDLIQVAVLALKPRLIAAMGPRKGPGLLKNERYEKLVLLKQVQAVAFLADDIPVLSLLPFEEGLLHHVA